jgi:hypothetical protein
MGPQDTQLVLGIGLEEVPNRGGDALTNGPMTASEIAKATGIGTGTVTRC